MIQHAAKVIMNLFVKRIVYNFITTLPIVGLYCSIRSDILRNLFVVPVSLTFRSQNSFQEYF